MLEIEPITLVRLLDKLEAAGLVERRPDPNDRRVRRLYLTEATGPLLDAACRPRLRNARGGSGRLEPMRNASN